MKLRFFLIGISLSAAALTAQDPPSRVARLNFINGTVSFQPASLDTWTSATLNYPLTTGDHLYTDTASRAEAHIGANAIRLDSHTNFGFLNLDDATVQMRFTEGAMEVRLRALDDRDLYEVDTPNGAISLLRIGDYRIDTDPDRNATMVTVFSGEVEVTANGSSFAVHPRQTAYFTEGVDPDIRTANLPDDFDEFTRDRNVREERLPRPEHVSSSMVGYEDLSAYGSWRQVPEYGWCWAPPVQAGWAPYRDGHWAWVEPWGWTWIDEAPWGFAPFHYGRWALAGGGWVWIPGAAVVHPVYAPALVAFVGGPRFSLSLGIAGGVGAVAWFPLGPQEVYRPAYRVSNTYIHNVNVTNVTNVTNITNVNVNNVRYINQNVQGAVTAVPQNAFAGGRRVSSAAVRVPPQQIARAQVVGTAPPVAPVRESIAGEARGNVPRPNSAVLSRQVVAKATPPPPPIAFEAKQAALAQNQGRPLAPDQVTQLRQQQPTAIINRAPVRSAIVPGQPAEGRRGALRFPAAAAVPQAPQAPQVQPVPNAGAFRNAPAVNAPEAAPTAGSRLDSRPPTARPLPATPLPGSQAAPDQSVQQPNFGRPVQENQPLPERQRRFDRLPQTQQPVVNRPAPENRPAAPIPAVPDQGPRRFERAPEPQQPPANRPAPENRPAFNRSENQPGAVRPNAVPAPNAPAPRNQRLDRVPPGRADAEAPAKKEPGKEERR